MRRYLIIAAVLVLAVVLGLTITSCHWEKMADQNHEQAMYWRGRAEDQTSLVQSLVAQRNELQDQTRALTDRIAELTRKRRPIPPAPVPVPDEDLQRSLVASGISAPLVVAEGLSPALPVSDARLVWSWAGQAARIPAFEERVAQDAVLLAAKDDLAAAIKAELRNCDEKGRALGAQAGAFKNEALALRSENEGLVKKQVAEKYRTRVVVGVAIPAAAYLGWKLGRR